MITLLEGFAAGVLFMAAIQLIRGSFFLFNSTLYAWCVWRGGDLMHIGPPKKNRKGEYPHWYNWLHSIEEKA